MNYAEQIREALPAAQDELTKKSYTQIQAETAIKWAARAIACFIHSLESPTAGLALGAYEMGCSFADEALEHAALIENADMVSQIGTEIAEAKEKAYNALLPADDTPVEPVVEQPTEQAAPVPAPAEAEEKKEESTDAQKE